MNINKKDVRKFARMVAASQFRAQDYSRTHITCIVDAIESGILEVSAKYETRIAELEATIEAQSEHIDELGKEAEVAVRRQRGLGDPSLAR